jgi:thiol:disulfide interchange protein DsbD
MNLQGNQLDYLVAFLGGLLVSFSPCVYPLVPVTISFIGINPSTKKLAGFTLSLVYVTGIALVYAILGLLAALSGTIFGQISVHPATRIITGIIFIFFGLSLWEIFPLRTMVVTHGISINKSGLGKVFLLGLSSGLVISPCTSPVLGSILMFVASRKNLFYGTTLLLIFAYGMGFILILAGTFSAILSTLPKSGAWMKKLKILSGLILMGVGVYFIFMGIIGG